MRPTRIAKAALRVLSMSYKQRKNKQANPLKVNAQHIIKIKINKAVIKMVKVLVQKTALIQRSADIAQFPSTQTHKIELQSGRQGSGQQLGGKKQQFTWTCLEKMPFMLKKKNKLYENLRASDTQKSSNFLKALIALFFCLK